MAQLHPNQEIIEAEGRYRRLRAAVADYHYHVRIEDGRVAEKDLRSEFRGHYRISVRTNMLPNPELWLEIVLEEDRPLFERQSAEVLAGRQPPAIEYRIRRKDGQVRWIQNAVVPTTTREVVCDRL